jgi:hypothetical protein
MPPAGFEPTISAGQRQQTYVLDRAANGNSRDGFVFTPSCIAEYSLCLLSAGAYSRNGKYFDIWTVQVKVHTCQENIRTMDTVCHLVISDSKHMERIVTCGFIFPILEVHGSDVLRKVRTSTADATRTTPRVFMSASVAKEQIIPNFRVSPVVGGVVDVHLPDSVTSLGRRRQKVIQTYLRTRPKKRSTDLHSTDMYGVCCLLPLDHNHDR